jgi:hypothetical protein
MLELLSCDARPRRANHIIMAFSFTIFAFYVLPAHCCTTKPEELLMSFRLLLAWLVALECFSFPACFPCALKVYRERTHLDKWQFHCAFSNFLRPRRNLFSRAQQLSSLFPLLLWMLETCHGTSGKMFKIKLMAKQRRTQTRLIFQKLPIKSFCALA